MACGSICKIPQHVAEVKYSWETGGEGEHDLAIIAAENLMGSLYCSVMQSLNIAEKSSQDILLLDIQNQV